MIWVLTLEMLSFEDQMNIFLNIAPKCADSVWIFPINQMLTFSNHVNVSFNVFFLLETGTILKVSISNIHLQRSASITQRTDRPN